MLLNVWTRGKLSKMQPQACYLRERKKLTLCRTSNGKQPFCQTLLDSGTPGIKRPFRGDSSKDPWEKEQHRLFDIFDLEGI